MTKNIAKMIIIPSGSQEQMVQFGPVDLPGQPIWMAGYCQHKAGYLIHQPHAKRHIILYCLKGSYYYYVDGDKKLLGVGQILYLPAGTDQHFGLADSEGEAIFFLLASEAAEMHSPQCLEGNSHILMKHLMLRAFDEQNQPHGDSTVLAGCRALIVSLLYADMNFTQVQMERLDGLMAKLRQKPGVAWTVGMMAAECGMAQSYFFVLCKKYFSCSPHQLLRSIRMEYACRLLMQTDYPVKVISEMCGYACPFAFSRVFSSEMGKSPKEYRNSKS